MSKYSFSMIRISIFTPKIISDHLEGADQPPGSLNNGLQVVMYCIDVRIEILIIENIYLDIHEGILECDLYTCIWPASRWPNIFLIIPEIICTCTVKKREIKLHAFSREMNVINLIILWYTLKKKIMHF